jgi:hypothetical protein
MRRIVGFPLIVAALSVGGTAIADDSSPFDAAAAKAQRVRKLDRMVWALTASCDQGDDLDRRQCRILREGAVERMRGATVLVDVAPGAFEVGAWDAAKKSTALTLRGCVSCTGVEVDGKKWYVVSNKQAPKISGDKLQAATIHETAQTFADDAAAREWQASVVPRLRTQMLVKVPDKKAIWNRDGAHGLAIEIIGYRVYDACDGSIVVSSPESGSVAADKKACGAAVAKVDPDAGKPKEVIHAELSKAQILAALKPAVAEAKACFEAHGIAGDAKLKITIGGNGSVLAAEQSGDFVGTPTGGCIDTAIKKATFPKSKKARVTISYPVSLR